MNRAIIKAYPFLGQLSQNILITLDLGVLCIPNAQELLLLQELEQLIGAYLVIYFNQEPVSGHLCRQIVPAPLTVGQVALLKEAERKMQGKNKILVAYQKPLKLIQRL